MKTILLLFAGIALVAAAAVALVPFNASVPNNPSYHCGSPVRRLQAATRQRWDRDSYLTKLGNGSIPNDRLPNRVCRRKGRRRLVVAVGLGGVGVVLAGVAVFLVPGRRRVGRPGGASPGEGPPVSTGDVAGSPGS